MSNRRGLMSLVGTSMTSTSPRRSVSGPHGSSSTFEHDEERIHVTADQSIDVLGGAGGRVEPVLKQGAALEQEQLTSVLVERTLDRADSDR